MKRAFITGITGQDGSYLAELLLSKDYEIYGLIRRTSTTGTWRLASILDRLRLIPGDMTDSGSLERALKLADPQEVYNLASQSSVSHSFEVPLHTSDVTGLGALRLFEAVRQFCPEAHVYQASSSEQFGQPVESPQDEETPFNPVSPYACAKVFAHHCAKIYRSAYKLYITCGIAFNHESPLRGSEFVSQKICQAVARIKRKAQFVLRLGSLEAKRDWNHARDIVKGVWLSLQQPQPDDYVFASGTSHSVEEFVDRAFQIAGLNPSEFVVSEPGLFRPLDIPESCGNATKAKRQLGWSPSYTFDQLVEEMVDAALNPTDISNPLRTG